MSTTVDQSSVPSPRQAPPHPGALSHSLSLSTRSGGTKDSSTTSPMSWTAAEGQAVTSPLSSGSSGSSISSRPSHTRRPSLPMSPSLLSTSPRAVPVPVPNRGPVPVSSSHRQSFSGSPLDGSSLSSWMSGSLSRETGSTLLRRGSHNRNTSSTSLSGSLFVPNPTGLPGSLPKHDLDDPGASLLGRSQSDRRPSAGIPDLSRSRAGSTSIARTVDKNPNPMEASMVLAQKAEVENEILQRSKSEQGRKWLDITAGQILQDRAEAVKVVQGTCGMEEAVETYLKYNAQCLLVDHGRGSYGFFDFADLNTFLLLVLHASSSAPPVSRSPSRPFPGSNTSANIKHLRANSFNAESAIIEEGEDVERGVLGLDERANIIVVRLKKGDKVVVGDMCDISQKNPYHSFPETTPFKTLLPLFSSGLHRIAIASASGHPRILSDKAVLDYITSLPIDVQPPILNLSVSSSCLSTPLHALISLPGTASVLDAMQIMSLRGLSALGVLSGSGSSARSRRESSGSSGSSSSNSNSLSSLKRDTSGTALSNLTASPMMIPLASPSLGEGQALDGVGVGLGHGELIAVVSARECTRLVIPSQGKQVLGMGLEEMVKGMQYAEEAGADRGEERVPIHTIPYSSTLLHASHLILATSSHRVFLRTPPGTLSISPPLSPTPSLTTSLSSPPESPSLSSLSLSDKYPVFATSVLPPPPPTLLSPHYVVSTVDILNVLGKTYGEFLTPPSDIAIRHRVRGSIDNSLMMGMRGMTHNVVGNVQIAGEGETGGGGKSWDLDPQGLSKRRRASSFEASNPESGGGAPSSGGFESWRWAGRVGRV